MPETSRRRLWPFAVIAALALGPKASAQGTRADYDRAASAAERSRGKVLNASIDAQWLTADTLWYRRDLPGGERRFIRVDAATGVKSDLFDHAAFARAALDLSGRTLDAGRLPIERIDRSPTGLVILMRDDARVWTIADADGKVAQAAAGDATPFHLEPMRDVGASLGGGPETSITFVNRTSETIKLYWIDAEGHRRPYNRLDPGGEASQHTFAGHAWAAVGADGRDLGVYIASKRPSIAVIRPAEEPANQALPPRSPGSPREDAAPDEQPRGDAARSENARRRVGDGARRSPAAARGAWVQSPDGRRAVTVRDSNLYTVDDTGAEIALTTDGTPDDPYTPPLEWSPDSRKLVVVQSRRGGGRRVTYIESSPHDSQDVQPRVHTYGYLKPGDEITLRRPRLFDMTANKPIAIKEDLFPTPWRMDSIRWAEDSSRFTFEYNQRGHQAVRVIGVDAATGEARAIINETSPTFIDYAGKWFIQYLDKTGEIIWMSERDGWNHLYLYDAAAGTVKNQITRGEWVVRGVERVDVDARRIWFRASGVYPGQDPYYIHHARVNCDGSDLTFLTTGDGVHSVSYSPDQRYFIDSYSRVDLPPVSELRRVDTGALVCELERADAGELLESGWRPPERFSAKGRDGVTDIHGVIVRPSNFDAAKRYPVIENIYAGPHDSFVPKSFRTAYQYAELAELGFIVVQIDGMGTSNRSKAFHDVCWKNLGDAGFPDRIAWLRAAAAAHPEFDLDNHGRGVGIYGGSAGGQNAARAVIAQGDFYGAAVADCGCHDNRMDKIWWNELWMGWPVDESYARSSNVVHAGELPDRCKLMLVVGEMDENVDPASTMQVADALIRADKDFELLVIPGAGHGACESPYGRRRRQDFFVRSLMGVEPRR